MTTLIPLLLLLAAPPAPPTTAPAVLRGERVVLTARAGVVVVSVDAEAMQDGRTGDAIRVRNLQSGKVQLARVAGAGQVEVTP